MAPTITADKARRNFDEVLDQADREEVILIKKGHIFYHLHRESTEKELIEGLQDSMREFKTGKAKVLKSLADLD